MYKLLILLIFILVGITACMSKYAFVSYTWRLSVLQGNISLAESTYEYFNDIYIIFDANLFSKKTGSVYGNGSCNNFNGTYKVDQNLITFSNIIVTKKYCEEKSLLEHEFLEQLHAAKYIIENNKQLTFYNANKDLILIFEQQ